KRCQSSNATCSVGARNDASVQCVRSRETTTSFPSRLPSFKLASFIRFRPRGRFVRLTPVSFRRTVETFGQNLPKSTLAALPPGRPAEPFQDASSPVHHDLAGIAALHRVKPRLIVVDADAVSDKAAHVQRALHQGDHLVPGLEHFTPIDAFQGQHLEDDLVPVDLEPGRRNAKYGYPAAIV